MGSDNGILERLEKGTVLGAEGYVFELERRGYLQAGPFVPEVVLENPGAVKALHKEFLDAGAEVMLALTYYGHREKMKAVGREGDLESLNRVAVRLAREVAAESNALVAGNLSNAGVYDHNNPEETSKQLRAIYDEQVKWAYEEGIDFVIAETLSSLGEGLIALESIKKYDLPAMITFIPFAPRKMMDGYTYEEACKILADNGAEIVGLNCGRGPNTMMPLLERIRDKVDGFIAAQPVPYRTTEEQHSFHFLQEPGHGMGFPIALDPFTHTRHEMAEFAAQAEEIGVNYIGICCGAGPHHVRAMAEALGRTPPASRYSPAMDKHPMFQEGVQERIQALRESWSAEAE